MENEMPWSKQYADVLKERPIRIVEVAILRCIALNEMNGIVEADNSNPGGGEMFIFLTDGTKLKVSIEVCAMAVKDL